MNKSESAAMKHLLSIVAHHFGKIVGNEYAKVYLKVKDVDRRLSLKSVSPKDKLLDVGGGLGLDDFLFANKGAYPIIVDLNSQDLKKAKKISQDLKLHDKIDYLIADARKLPFVDGAFDVVTSFSAIEHLPCRCEFKVWIREMTRVLKNNGGKFILTTSNKLWIMYPIAKLLMALKRRSPEHFFKPKEIMEELKQCNLDIETFDAGIIFYRGYSLIPLPRTFYEVLEKLLNKLDSFHCLRIICGRMGVRAKKKIPSS